MEPPPPPGPPKGSQSVEASKGRPATTASRNRVPTRGLGHSFELRRLDTLRDEIFPGETENTIRRIHRPTPINITLNPALQFNFGQFHMNVQRNGEHLALFTPSAALIIQRAAYVDLLRRLCGITDIEFQRITRMTPEQRQFLIQMIHLLNLLPNPQ